MRIVLIILAFLFILAGFLFKDRLLFVFRKTPVAQHEVYDGVSYEGTSEDYRVSLFASGLASPTRVRFSPDGNFLLATQITGEVIAFSRNDDGTINATPSRTVHVETRFPGFPPEEGGLVSVVFSTDYQKTGRIFLLHNYKDRNGKIYNRVSTSSLSTQNRKLIGSKPQVIFQANIDGSHSHQITDGVSVDIQGTPHLLFAVGEGFKAERALDPKLEAGKILLIQYDGTSPKGHRPYPDNPKVEAIGIRNAYVLLTHPSDPHNRVIIADTGPNKYDRLIMAGLGTGKRLKPYAFGWDGNQEKLKDPIPDPNIRAVADLVITRLPETRTFTGLAFDNEGNVAATLFGQTGSKKNSPGKELWLGKMTGISSQPKVDFTPIIRRKNEADGKLGNPIGLAYDPLDQSFYFADILEGRIYRVIKIK